MRKEGHKGFYLPPTLQFALSKGVFLLALIPPILLFEHSQDLGYWWAALLLLYSAVLIYILSRISYRREMKVLRHDLGDEQFFRAFPAERRREERRVRRKQRRAEVRRRRELEKLGL